MSDKIRIVGLGGLDEEGKECTVVEINGDIFVVNCGIREPDRTMPGIDYVIPRYDYLEENKDRVKAYFLLHGHDDAMGGLLFVYEKAPAPIYCSKVTKTMVENFARHIGKDISKFEFVLVPPTSSFVVAKRKIRFFHTSHNVADSSGIALSTDQGNIVYCSDFVVENTATPSFLFDTRALGRIAEEPTLILMTESLYANRPGYTAPNYRLTPLIAQNFKSAPGRIFVSVFSNNFFNVGEVINLAIENKKKIIPYDDLTLDMLETMEKSGQISIPNSCRGSLDDVLRLRDQDILILISAFGGKLFRKIALLASGENEDKRIKIKPEDTFFWASPSDDNTELEYTDAIDETYRTGCKVFNINKKSFLRMHASQEDIKTLISLLRPKYYLPVRGFYKDLLANGMLALSMGVGLNHSNVFVVENGASILIDSSGARVFDEKIPHGDLMIDGSGVGDVSEQVLEDRQELSEGVVILAVTVSRSKKKIVAGPDVQMRGFVYAKDAELIQRDASKIFVATVNDFLAQDGYRLEEIRQTVYERCLRAIRRQTGKEPMVLPLIIEVA
mgnify:CR=1 FL=1